MREWLKKLREEVRLSQAELAHQVGISEQFVYYIESGERRPSVNTAKKIAEVLGFDWTRFFEDETT